MIVLLGIAVDSASEEILSWAYLLHAGDAPVYPTIEDMIKVVWMISTTTVVHLSSALSEIGRAMIQFYGERIWHSRRGAYSAEGG